MTNQKKRAISRLSQCRHILSQRFRPALFSLAILLLLTAAALAQLTTADILGTVTDQTGASVPNASVTLTNLGTNDQRTVQSNGTGDYTFTLLPVGHYSISVKAGGFQESITKESAELCCNPMFVSRAVCPRRVCVFPVEVEVGFISSVM